MVALSSFCTPLGNKLAVGNVKNITHIVPLIVDEMSRLDDIEKITSEGRTAHEEWVSIPGREYIVAPDGTFRRLKPSNESKGGVLDRRVTRIIVPRSSSEAIMKATRDEDRYTSRKGSASVSIRDFTQPTVAVRSSLMQQAPTTSVDIRCWK